MHQLYYKLKGDDGIDIDRNVKLWRRVEVFYENSKNENEIEDDDNEDNTVRINLYQVKNDENADNIVDFKNFEVQFAKLLY